MPREKLEGNNSEILTFGLSVIGKEKGRLEKYKNKPRVFVYENASKLAIEKAKDL